MTTTVVPPLRQAAHTSTLDVTVPDLMGAFRDAEAQRWAARITTDIFAWLRSSGFDPDDQREFVRDLTEAVAGTPDDIAEVIREWRLTAEALADPTRREILLGDNTDADYVEVQRPE
jgi:hypothetical protein